MEHTTHDRPAHVVTTRRSVRTAIGLLTIGSAQVGVWALFAPRSFYDDFPGSGTGWVSADGPYNEHLVRDVGALNLALAVLLIAAAIRCSRDLVRVAAIASLVWSVPHAVYHLTADDDLDPPAAVVSVGVLVLSTVVAGLLLSLSRHLAPSDPPSRPI